METLLSLQMYLALSGVCWCSNDSIESNLLERSVREQKKKTRINSNLAASSLPLLFQGEQKKK